MMTRARIFLVTAGAAAAAIVAASCATSPPASSAAAPGAGRFVWHDLITRDPAACRKFYGELLDWDFQDATRNGKPYLVARSNGRYAAGIAAAPAQTPAGPAVWLPYLSVADLEGRIAGAKGGGAQVLVAPTAVGPYGRAAVIKDPQGAAIGLVALARAVPGDGEEPIVGRFFWDEYLARDASSALDFYKGLAGWQSALAEQKSDIAYHVLRNERSRAGMFQLPSEVKGVEPNWLPYVRVDDPAAMAARAESLGGKVLISPSSGIRGGTLAVVADPTGGAIALQKWPLPKA